MKKGLKNYLYQTAYQLLIVLTPLLTAPCLARALGTDGRILVRESGTEPLIRVMVEAGTDDLCHKYVDSVVDVMEAEGLVVE